MKKNHSLSPIYSLILKTFETNTKKYSLPPPTWKQTHPKHVFGLGGSIVAPTPAYPEKRTPSKSSFVARVVLTKHMTKAQLKLELSVCFRVSMESIGRLMNIDWIG